MRAAAVAAALAAVLAADVAVLATRAPAPPRSYTGIVAADLERAGLTRAAVPGAEPDTDPCRPDWLLRDAAPLDRATWTYAPRRSLTFVTARVRRWAVEADAVAAFRAVRDGLRDCRSYDVAAPNGAVLVFGYEDVDGAGLGDDALRVVSAGGFAGSGRVERWEHQYVVRAGPYLLDVRSAGYGRYDAAAARPAPCWAEFFLEALRGGRPRPCDAGT